MRKILKDKGILKKKPNLNLKPNHYHYLSDAPRFWNSETRSQAVSDGKGWYK